MPLPRHSLSLSLHCFAGGLATAVASACMQRPIWRKIWPRRTAAEGLTAACSPAEGQRWVSWGEAGTEALAVPHWTAQLSVAVALPGGGGLAEGRAIRDPDLTSPPTFNLASALDSNLDNVARLATLFSRPLPHNLIFKPSACRFSPGMNVIVLSISARDSRI